jgi:hypothetical protein
LAKGDSNTARRNAMTKQNVPPGLTRCEVCGEYRGRVRSGDLDHEPPGTDPERMIPVWCMCGDGSTLCPRCKRNRMRRPFTNRYDPAQNVVWHVNQWSGLAGCAECRERYIQERGY